MATKKAKPKTTSRRKLTEFQWDERRNLAAQLVAEGQKTDDQIAEQCGVSRAAFAKWKVVPEFKARVEQIVAESAEALKGAGIRDKENRLNNLQRRIDKMHALIDARAAKMAETKEIEGGETGLLVRDYKGKMAFNDDGKLEMQAVYKFDAALMRELREHEKQAAIELAQWTEKHEHKVEAVTQITTIEAVKPDGAD